MKILIVGGTSSLGISLKPILSKGAKIITAGRKKCDFYMDLNNSIDDIEIPYDIDVIIHTAASFGGSSDKEIEEAESFNVLGTLKLCQWAVRKNVKHLIIISSIFATIKETSPHYNIYSLSKKHSEDIAKYYCNLHNLPLTILRPSQIYGIGSNYQIHQPFFNNILEKAQKGENITLYGSKDPLRNYIYIDDVVNIIDRVILYKIEGTYNCTQMDNVTYTQIANIAFDAFNTIGKIYFNKDKEDMKDNVFEIDESLYGIIKYYPTISIEEGIKKIVVNKIKNE